MFINAEKFKNLMAVHDAVFPFNCWRDLNSWDSIFLFRC
jgi:hypothetical protein